VPLLKRAALLLALLALLGAGAPVRAPAPLYPAAPGAWAGPLGAALAAPSLTASLSPSLASLSLESPGGLRSAAPLIAHLQGSLGYTPASFAALPASDRAAAVVLAAEAAKEEIRAKTYELAEQARAFGRLGQVNKEQRAELYALVAQLTELRDHYGPFLDQAEREEAAQAYTRAAGEAWKVRRALLGENVGEHAQALEDAGPRAAEPARPGRRRYRGPSAAAAKLRERMQDTMVGWGQDDFRDLYVGHGFVEREGGKHRFYSHVDHPDLHESVSRQNDLPIGYARDALKLLRELDRRLLADADAAGAAATLAAAHHGVAPPAGLTLDDLAILLSPPSERPKVKERPESVPERLAAKTRPGRGPPAAVAERTTPAKTRPDAAPESPAPPLSPAALAPFQPSEPLPRSELPAPSKPPEDTGLAARLKKLFPRWNR
jgi:hypothetical protein